MVGISQPYNTSPNTSPKAAHLMNPGSFLPAEFVLVSLPEAEADLVNRALEVPVFTAVVVLPSVSSVLGWTSVFSPVTVRGTTVAPGGKGGVSRTLRSEDFHRIWMATALVISRICSAVSEELASA